MYKVGDKATAVNGSLEEPIDFEARCDCDARQEGSGGRGGRGVKLQR